MLERELQEYLFHNPDTLFPGKTVQEKAKEYNIHGKRIDLLFRVDDVRYIVELKAVPLEREHIGQILEYYGLMKDYLGEAELKMILVAPSIPSFRSAFLEEVGMRCIEISDVPDTPKETAAITRTMKKIQNTEREEKEWADQLKPSDKFVFEEITAPVTSRTLGLTQRMLRDTLESVRSCYSEYEVTPKRIRMPHSHDVDCDNLVPDKAESPGVSSGGVWWAYAFGESHNDIPNISVIAYPKGLKVSINAELKPSQRIFISSIAKDPGSFDNLLKEHGGLWFTSFLKLEHQPRFYHWIPLDELPPGTFTGKEILNKQWEHENSFDKNLPYWINRIVKYNTNLTPRQEEQLRSRNKNLNLALRLAWFFEKDDPFWKEEYQGQVVAMKREVNKLKPLVDFFIK